MILYNFCNGLPQFGWQVCDWWNFSCCNFSWFVLMISRNFWYICHDLFSAVMMWISLICIAVCDLFLLFAIALWCSILSRCYFLSCAVVDVKTKHSWKVLTSAECAQLLEGFSIFIHCRLQWSGGNMPDCSVWDSVNHNIHSGVLISKITMICSLGLHFPHCSAWVYEYQL